MSIIEKAIGKLGSQSAGEKRSTGAPRDDVDEVKEALARVDRLASGESPAVDEVNAAGDTVDRDSALPAERKVRLPYQRLKEYGMVTPDAPRSSTAEEYRRVKRPLLMNIEGAVAPVKNPNLIMVTSALPGEGKTFSAINLALSIAMEQDKTVLFVDADVAKARGARLLGVPNDARGLIDILERDDLDLHDVLYRTDIPNLRILPAGRVHERSTELLASEDMRKLMSEMATRYRDRVVIFDSPPLLPTTEASVLANLMGQIVFVVAANKTGQNAVSEALSHIEGDKMIGMLLNKSTARFGLSYGYAYEYGYAYGYGYGEGARDSANG